MRAGVVVLDRDGVINDNRANVHVNSPGDFVLFPDAGDAIRLLNEQGYRVMVATNQGGVGLGFLKKQTLDEIHRVMKAELSAQGATITDIAACTHKPKAGCSCRKPEPGMLLQLQERHGFSLAESFMVGDMETDIEAGHAAGARAVLIGSGPSKAEYVASSLMDAAKWILAQPHGTTLGD